jgi:hypothetical protein
MPSWVADVVVTFALSLILASGFLRRPCRGHGHPFGPRARPWAFLIMAETAIVATGVGLLIAAASRDITAVYAGLIVPSVLWRITLPLQRDAVPARTPGAWLTLPFGRLYDRMGDDMEEWSETRVAAASVKPQWIADAVEYYDNQVQSRLKDNKARADLGRWRERVVHKIGVTRLIGQDASLTQVRTELQMHDSTRRIRIDDDGDLQWLADRLETEALNELKLFLKYLYRLGYHKLLIYPFRPSVHRTPVGRA